MPSVFVMRQAVSVGVANDNFNRADSTSNINPASDGGSWTVDGGTWGISSNRGYIASITGAVSSRTNYGFATVSTARTGSAVDVSVTNYRANANGRSGLVFATGVPPSSDALFLQFRAVADFFSVSGNTTTLTVNHSTGTTLTVLASYNVTPWDGGSTTFRVVYDSSTGTCTVYQNGSSVGSLTVPSGKRITPDCVAFGSQVDTAGEFWDDFSVT